MGKNNKLAIALPVLLVVAVLVWMPHLKSPVSKSRKMGNNKFKKDAAFSHNEVMALVKVMSSTSVFGGDDAAWGERNPFVSERVIKETNKDEGEKNKNPIEAHYYLSGIFWNEQKPSAIINDLVLNVGSVIGSSTVKEINANKVILFDGLKDIVLILRESNSIP
jgi:hypothetical protein